MKYLIACVVLLNVVSHAQEPAIPSALGTAPLTGEAATLRSNVFVYGLDLSEGFDDNATDVYHPAQTGTNVTSSFQPQARIMVKRNHLDSSLFYSPSFTYSSNIDGYNSASHAAGTEFNYAFSKRLSLQFRNAFSLTTNPYDNLRANAELPGLGVLNRPNESALGANLRVLSEQSQADLVYRLGRHTSVDVGGSFADLQYKAVGVQTQTGPALHSRTYSGHTSFSQQLIPRYSVGVQYTAQPSWSSSARGTFSGLSHQFLGFVNIALTPKIKLSLFAGPEFSSFDNTFMTVPLPLTEHFAHTSFAGGSTVTWQGDRNGLSGTFVRQVSDSGLNGTGSVIVQTVNLQMQRQLLRRLTFTMLGNYVSNHQLNGSGTGLLADSVVAEIGVTRPLTEHLNLSVSATRQQFLGGAVGGLPGFLQHNHDVVAAGLHYSFARPIGR